jgi:NodT family efflux transporter outer membrane factor (OMF) lipoprotein
MPSTNPFLATILSAGVLAGCAVGPDYVRPVVPASATFAGQHAIEQRSTGHVAELASWWTGFNDPMLTRLVALALQKNLDIAQAGARLSQSRAALRYADAQLAPSGEVSGQAAKVRQSVDTPLGQLLNATPDFDRNGKYYETDLGASWEIDVFGGLRRGRQAAIADYQATEAGVVATQLAVEAQTADVYVTIRGLQARLAIAQQQVQTQQHLLDIITLQYAKGVAAELQVRQAQGALAQVQATVPILKSGLDAAMNALDVLLGAPPGTYRTELAAKGSIPTAPGFATTGTPSDLIRRRPDLIAAERRLAASNARIGVAIAEYFPKFSLGGLFGSASTQSASMFTGSSEQVQGFFGLRWRLFDFGRIDAEIAAARGKNAESLAAYRLAVLRASEDVEDAFSALANREAQASVLAQGESSLSRAQSVSLMAYKGGIVSLIEVLDADSNLLHTRDAQAQAQTEATKAAIASFKALGGGWDSSRGPLASLASASPPR